MLVFREAEIKKAFKTLDKDGNGFISKAEMKQAIMESIEKTVIREMFDEADLDGDGQIDYLEFERINNLTKKSSVFGKKKSEETEELVTAPPKPPDGGWGWAVVFACFMCNLVISKFIIFITVSYQKWICIIVTLKLLR